MTEPVRPAGAGEPRDVVSTLIRAGDCEGAIKAADELLHETSDGYEVVGVLLSKLAALLNLNRIGECTPVIDDLWDRLQHRGVTPGQVAEFHGLAADSAFRQKAVARCVMHLVRGSRALEDVAGGRAAVRSWVTNATAYSYVGFHRQAVAALTRAQQMVASGTLDERRVAAQPEVHVRQAAFLDQGGESARALEVLTELIGRLGPDDAEVITRPYLGYAIARYLVLGGEHGSAGPPGADPALALALLDAGRDSVPECVELWRLGAAALAIADDRPREGLELLADAEVTFCFLGGAEIPRLRSLAFTRLGDYEAAYAAQCEVTAALSQAASRLYDLFVDGVAARLDYDELLRNVSRYADEALTDPLTSLPNRRHLERHVADLLDRGGRGVIGVADVDHFKEVNTTHGHLVGDQVLQQVAAVLSRTLRDRDFLARFAGDEFVLVLPQTTLPEARSIADRLAAAVAGDSWQSVVPGTPVTVTIGLATFDRSANLAEAFRAADLRMLQAKQG